MIVELLLHINCKHCHQDFLLCRCCYRGQRYCCNECRIIAQLESRRRAQKQYRQTENGRKVRREAERRRRIRKNRGIKKSVGDQGSTPIITRVIITPSPLKNIGHCYYCGVAGVIVERFPRRGYGRRGSGRYHGKQNAYNPCNST